MKMVIFIDDVMVLFGADVKKMLILRDFDNTKNMFMITESHT